MTIGQARAQLLITHSKVLMAILDKIDDANLVPIQRELAVALQNYRGLVTPKK